MWWRGDALNVKIGDAGCKECLLRYHIIIQNVNIENIIYKNAYKNRYISKCMINASGNQYAHHISENFIL